jgi:hypothetical protein
MPEDEQVQPVLERVPSACERPASRWIDDDVIDFPSVMPLVERMQAAFFGGPTGEAPVAADVDLSVRQAMAGGPVSVRVPLRRPCRPCGGRGEVGDEPCAACDGAGHALVQETVQVQIPRGVADGARFRLSLRALGTGSDVFDLRIRVR